MQTQQSNSVYLNGIPPALKPVPVHFRLAVSCCAAYVYMLVASNGFSIGVVVVHIGDVGKREPSGGGSTVIDLGSRC